MANPLEKCPHMKAVCPHYRAECANPTSNQCQYVQRHKATLLAVLAAVDAKQGVWRDERLSRDISKYLAAVNAALREMGMDYYGYK